MVKSNAVPDPRSRIRHLLDRGEMWVIDPRRTETARMATRHLSPRPGTDHIWLAAVLREMLTTADADLLSRTTIGYDELAAAVEPYTLDVASGKTGLDRRDLEDLITALRTHGRFPGVTGTGVTMTASANLTQWLMMSLLVITDSADAPGGSGSIPGTSGRWTPTTGAGGIFARVPVRPHVPSCPAVRANARHRADR